MTKYCKSGLLENLAYNLRLRRELAGLTQMDVEMSTGIDTSTLSTYERAVAEPLSTNLYRLARFYDTSVEALFQDWMEVQRRLNGFMEKEGD